MSGLEIAKEISAALTLGMSVYLLSWFCWLLLGAGKEKGEAVTIHYISLFLGVLAALVGFSS